LRNPDFFDVAKHPTIEFRSKRIEKSGGKLAVRGDLTIHGVTREVVLELDGPTPEIKDPRGNFRRGATATTKINRKDFGLTWNRALEAGGVVVGDEVSITIEVEAMRPGK
jgi:polyisoprenoid-binding protein YceI